MLNVFMLCRDDPAAAAQSLAALVQAAVLGHVGRVVMRIAEDDEGLRRLSEEAGCDLAAGAGAAELFAAARAERPGWWIVMREGQIPADGWSDAAVRHIALNRSIAIMLPAKGFWRIMTARFAGFFGQPETHHHILVVPPDQALGNRGDALGCSARPAVLKTTFEI